MGVGRFLFSAISNGKGKRTGQYFDDITVERVKSEEDGWNKIQDKPWGQ